MVDGDALEMRFGETQRGFESPPLRSKIFPNVNQNLKLTSYCHLGDFPWIADRFAVDY